jgi:hypothetical protein
VFDHGRPFLLRPIFAGKARSLPILGETTGWCSAQVGPSFTHKDKTILERTAKDKHSSLLKVFFNKDHKIFIALCTGSTLVEHSTHNPMIKGSNLASVNRREKMAYKFFI